MQEQPEEKTSSCGKRFFGAPAYLQSVFIYVIMILVFGKEGFLVELSFLLMQQILSMALMILMGYVLTKCGLIRSENSTTLAAISLYLVVPCVIIDSFQQPFTTDKVKGLALAVGAAAVLHLLFLLLTKCIGDAAKLDRIERASLIYSNGGNLIIPLVSALMGNEMIFYCCAFIAVQNVLIWTHGITMISAAGRFQWKKVLLSPNIIAIVLGLGFFFTGFTLPEILGSTIEKVGSIIGPISMLVIGMIMAGTDLKRVFFNKRAYLVCFGRLLLYPFLLILLFKLTGAPQFFAGAEQILLVTLLAAASSVAVTVTNMADLFGADSAQAGAINVMSVIFCIVTMPLMVMLYQTICL